MPNYSFPHWPNMNSCFLTIAFVSSLVFAELLLADGAQQNQKTIKVGAILSLTGHASVHGNNIREGLELARADLESNGWTVDLAIEDDGTQASRAISATHSLSARGYNLLIGPVWSFLLEAAIPVFERENLLSFAPATSSVVVGKKSRNVFHGISFGQAQLAPLTDWLNSQKAKKVAIVYAESTWGQVHSQLYQEATQMAGAKVVAVERFGYGEEATTLPVLIMRIRQKHPDVILTTGSAQSSALIVKRVKELKMDTKIVSTDDMQDAVLLGLINTTDKDAPAVFSLVAQIDEGFRKKFFQAFNKEAGIYADSAYDGLMILATALERGAGSIEQIRDYLHNDLIYQGYSGRFDFDVHGDTQKTVFAVEELSSAVTFNQRKN